MLQYGDEPALLWSALWFGSELEETEVSVEMSMDEGFHTYGIDLQPDLLTFYYDREIIYQTANNIPVEYVDVRSKKYSLNWPTLSTGSDQKYDRKMYVMVNLAYGGGGSSNSNLTSALAGGQVRDMMVKYLLQFPIL